MTQSTRKPGSGRRNFLLALGAGSAATAAVMLGKGAPAVVPAAGADAPAGKGYQLTEHVRTYYRTAKV